MEITDVENIHPIGDSPGPRFQDHTQPLVDTTASFEHRSLSVGCTTRDFE